MTKDDIQANLKFLEQQFMNGIQTEKDKCRVLIPIDLTHPMITLQSLSLALKVTQQISKMVDALTESNIIHGN